MLHRLLYADWEAPPEAMAFEVSYDEAITGLRDLLDRILPSMHGALADPASGAPDFWEACLQLYLMAPALVNIALNHKICVEQGLPLHPTQYFEVSEKTRYQVTYPDPEVERAQAFFLDAIATARAIVNLGPGCIQRLETFARDVPEAIRGFVYTSTRDKYTWRASDPGKIVTLATEVQRAVRPVAVVGAAHGAIMSGLLLANLLEAPLYFLRFSLFKRKDKAPVISPTDLRFLAAYREGPVLLFDEDVAKGTTLTHFTDFLQPFFHRSYSAGVLRHGHAAFRPDFIGQVWWD